jgi:hypothetical protein
MDLKPAYKTVVGMDVHQKTIAACVMTLKGNDMEPTIVTCEFKTYKGGLNILAKWCKDHGAEAITMESTGIYCLFFGGLKPHALAGSFSISS